VTTGTVTRALARTLLPALVFALSIDRPTIPFGTVDPGGSVELLDRHTVTVVADDGAVWYLKVRHFGDVPGLTLSYRASGGRGTGAPAWTPIAEFPSLAYTSSVAEGTTGALGVPLMFSYRLEAAADAEAGESSWILTYTLSVAP